MKNNNSILKLIISTALALSAGNSMAATSVWNGNGGTTNWSTTANWTSTLPGGADDVKFYDGGTSNSPGIINNVVNTDFSGTIKSLQYANSNGFHTTQIAANKSLTITNGLTVGTGTSNGANFQVIATIKGAGGSLLLTNGNITVGQANIQTAKGTHIAILNLEGLDTLAGQPGRIIVGQGSAANRDVTGMLILARTNLLTLTGSTSPQFVVGDATDGSANTGTNSSVLLGQTNAILANNFTVGRAKQPYVSLSFNPNFTSPSVYLRSQTGGRISNLSVGDGSSGGATSGSATNVMDLSAGTADIQADTVYVSRGQNGNGVGTMLGILTLGAGTLDVNTLDVGYVQNTTPGVSVTGIVNLASSGTLVVNTRLRLGYNPNAYNVFRQGYGTLNVNGGTIKCLGDIVDGSTWAAGSGYGYTSYLNVTNGLVDMFPAGDTSPGTITVKMLNLGSGGVITNASTITVSNTLTVAAGGVIAGTNTTINLPSGATMDVTASGFTLGTGQKLQNVGSVSGSFTNGPGATLLPGGQNNAGTLTFNNDLALNAGGKLALDLSNDPSQVGGANDLLQVNGSLVLNGTNTLTINPLNGSLGNGAYTLINCASITGGDATYFQIAGALNGTRRQLDFSTSSGTAVQLVVSGSDPASLVWSGGNSANTWDLKTTTNWNSGTQRFYSLDSVSFDDTGSVSPAVNLVGTLVPAAMTVNNSSQDYTFDGSGSITCGAGLTKQGSRKLTIAGTGSHVFSGGIDLQNGTLAFDRADTVAFAAVINNNGTLVNQGSGVVTLSGAIGGGGNVVQQGGELVLSGVNGYSGDTTISSGTLTVGGAGQLGSGSYPNNITNNGAFIYNSTAPQTLAGNLSGSGSLTHSNGLLTLTGNNTYTGGTLNAGGNLSVGDGAASGNLPPQPSGVLTNNAQLSFNRSDTITVSDQITGTGFLQEGSSGTVILSGSNSYSGRTIVGSINGGALRISHPNALGDTVGNTEIWGSNNRNMNGRLEIVGGISVAEPILMDARQNENTDVPAIVNVSGSNTLSGTISGGLGGGNWNIASDGGKLTFAGNFNNTAGSATRKLKLMGAGDGEWSGSINNAAGNASLTQVIKTNSGTWILSGANQYTGGTTNIEGTLLINGSLVAGDPVTNAVVNNSGATLGGSGTINGTLSIQGGSIVSNHVGSPLTVGALDMAGNATMNVATTSALGGGDYVLMSYTTLSGVGQFTTVNISGAGLAPSVTNYSVVIGGGAVKLHLLPLPSVNPNPTNITAVVASGQMNLSWPADHIGWYLQLQTNAPGAGLSSNWVTEPGSSSTNVFSLPIDPANGSVFGRLVYTNTP